MPTDTNTDLPPRPERAVLNGPPPIPQVDESNADKASVAYSHYRTGLSNHRTSLSEHRTDLSEFRTDLSTHRTDLSNHRTEMSMRRTGMSFQRTRMSADRTLMSVIRTSLSLIGFGFTVYQVFQKAVEAGAIHNAGAPRIFGVALLMLGVFILVGGIVNHASYGRQLSGQRGDMAKAGLIHGDSAFPVSITFLTAVALLLVGLGAVANVIWNLAHAG